MSQTLLFAVGVVVFFITVCATLLYGYSVLDRIYQAEASERPVISRPGDTSSPDGPSLVPVVPSTPAVPE